MIGQPTQSARIAGIARAQMALESAVARVPVPSATVATDQLGAVTLHVTYADKKTGLTISATGQTGA